MEPRKRETNVCLPSCPLSYTWAYTRTPSRGYRERFVYELRIERAILLFVTNAWSLLGERNAYAWFPLLAFGQKKTRLSLAFPESHGKRDSCATLSKQPTSEKTELMHCPDIPRPRPFLHRLFVMRRNCRRELPFLLLFFFLFSLALSPLLPYLVLA